METAALYIIKTLILPPGINIVFLLLGYFLINHFRKLAKLMIFISFITLYLFSTNYISRQLAGLVETTAHLPPAISAETDRQAIVILGGGRYVSMREYGKPVPHSVVLERLRYAMHIQRQTDLPILITGGRVFPTDQSEAEIMNQTLIDDFQFKASWLEEESRNTAQNAENSFEILNKESIDRIYLVTHASHMKRATDIFTNKGFDVIPAPTIFLSTGTNMPIFMQWLPKSRSLDTSKNILHEMIGQWWYKARHK